MYKKIIAVLMVTLMILMTGCGGSDTNTNTNTNSQVNNSNNQSEDSNNNNDSSKAEETFENFGEGKPAKMTGSGNKEFNLKMEEGGYYILMKTKDIPKGLTAVEIKSASSGMGVPMYASIGSGKDEDGWYVYERIEHWYSDDDNIFVVEAEGPYIIEVYKLPMTSGEKALPISFKGSGTKAIGPLSSDGSLTIKAKSSDAKQAGFVLNTIDGTTGQTIENVYMNINLDTHEVVNEFDITETVEVQGSGVYFIHITSNMNCQWEVEISQ